MGKCPDFHPTGNHQIGCKNIYVIDDKIYCGRRHPGSITLPQDNSMLDQGKRKHLGGLFTEYFQSIGLGGTKDETWELVQSFLDRGGIKTKISPELLSLVPDAEIVVDDHLAEKKGSI